MLVWVLTVECGVTWVVAILFARNGKCEIEYWKINNKKCSYFGLKMQMATDHVFVEKYLVFSCTRRIDIGRKDHFLNWQNGFKCYYLAKTCIHIFRKSGFRERNKVVKKLSQDVWGLWSIINGKSD